MTGAPPALSPPPAGGRTDRPHQAGLAEPPASRQPLPAGWAVEPMVQVRLDSGDLVELPASEDELTDLLSRVGRWSGTCPGTAG